MPITACLELLYPTNPGEPMRPAPEEVFTIFAIPLAFHYRNNVFQSKEGTLHVDIEDHFKGFGRIILYIGRDSFDPALLKNRRFYRISRPLHPHTL